MKNQLSLIHQQNTWLHYIGGYYKNTDKFINEAIRSRISRRAPAQQVRGMEFGDRLVLLRYQSKGNVSAFAEAQIVGITLDHEIANEVGEKLKVEGKAEFQEPRDGSNAIIERECGSYMVCGSWVVTCSLSEIMEMAIKLSKERDETLFVMVNAELTSIYDAPVYMQPAPKFTRGFIKPTEQSLYHITPPPTVTETSIVAIRNYQKAPRLSAVNG